MSTRPSLPSPMWVGAHLPTACSQRSPPSTSIPAKYILRLSDLRTKRHVSDNRRPYMNLITVRSCRICALALIITHSPSARLARNSNPRISNSFTFCLEAALSSSCRWMGHSPSAMRLRGAPYKEGGTSGSPQALYKELK